MRHIDRHGLQARILTQLAAEKLEQSIKRPAVLPRQSDKLPTLKALAANLNLSDKQASIITLGKNSVSL